MKNSRILLVLATLAAGLGVFRSVSADCTTPECVEVQQWGEYTNLTPPNSPTATLMLFEKKQGVELFSSKPAILGGTVTQHDTKMVNRRPNVVGLAQRDCPANFTDGKYYIAVMPAGLNPPVAEPWKFCADANGEGVKGSWNEGKKKDE